MNNRDYQVYVFECDWYSDFNDKDMHSYGLTMAPSFGEAVNAITKRLPYADHITIHEYPDTQFMFLNKGLYDRLIDPNDEDGLEFPDAKVKNCTVTKVK